MNLVNSFRMAHSRQICQFNSPTVIPIMDFLNHSKDVSNVEMSQSGTSYKCQATQDIKQVRCADSYAKNSLRSSNRSTINFDDKVKVRFRAKNFLLTMEENLIVFICAILALLILVQIRRSFKIP